MNSRGDRRGGRGRQRRDRGQRKPGGADQDVDWRSPQSDAGPEPLAEPDTALGRALHTLLTRLKSGADISAALDECRQELGKCGPESSVGAVTGVWSQVLLECSRVSVRHASFSGVAAFVADVHSICRCRLPPSVFHELVDAFCRSPDAHKLPVVGALAALVLGNVGEVQSRISRLMPVFEAGLRSEDDDGARLTSLQGMANLCYLEEPLPPASDFLRASWLPRLVAHFLTESARAYNRLCSMSDSLTRLLHLRQLKACLVGLSFLLCRQPKLDLTTVQALLLNLRAFAALSLTRAAHLPAMPPAHVAETATGRSPGQPLLPVRTKPGRRQAEFRHGPEPLELRLRSLRVSGDEELDQLLVSEESSDSEVEESPRPSLSPERSLSSKTRHLALVCLKRLLAITLRRVVHASWLEFLPGANPRQPPDLLTLLLKESLGKNRILILDAVQLFFDGSRQYLAAAEDVCEPSTAFTPYSSRLAASLREIHRRLVVALLAEREVGVQVHLLKCLALLVSGVPYHKLKPGLVTKVFRVARTYMDRVDSSADLRTGCLGVIGAILACDGPLFEVCHALSQPPAHFPALQEGLEGDHGSSSNSYPATPQMTLSGMQTPANFSAPGAVGGGFAMTSGSGALFSGGVNFGSCWLVSQCLQYAHPDFLCWDEVTGAPGSRERLRQSAPVRVQALATLRQMLTHYLRFLRPSLDPLKHTLKLCLGESGDNDQMMLRTQAIKLLTSLLPAMKEHDEEEWLRLWKEFVDPLIQGLQCESHYSVRSWSAQCLALADEAVFTHLQSRRLHLACMAIMLGRAGGPEVEPDGHVRGNAIRALGHWITVPSLYSDAGFVSDVVHRAMSLCVAVEDAHLVRSHAAWCLANAVEVLVAHKERSLGAQADSEAVLREFGVLRYVELLRTAVALCTGTVKHRENGARTLGYLFRLVPGGLLEHSEVGAVMRHGADVLADCMRLQESNGAAKIRWNACYAAGNLFRNGELALGQEWTRGIFLALRDALEADKYFKVRNYACLSLLLVTQRERFGETFQPLLAAVVRTLVQIAEGPGDGVAFSEAHHRSYLLYLCCLLVLRLLGIATVDDLNKSTVDLDPGLWNALPQVWAHLRLFQAQHAKDSLVPRFVIAYDCVHTSAEEVGRALHQLRLHLFGLVAVEPRPTCVSALCELVDRVANAERDEGETVSAFRQTYD